MFAIKISAATHGIVKALYESILPEVEVEWSNYDGLYFVWKEDKTYQLWNPGRMKREGKMLTSTTIEVFN